MDMDFFGVGPLEILFIFLIAFIIFGPKRLFDMSRNAGKAMHDFSKAASGFTAKIEKEMDASSIDLENKSRPENPKNE
jgi:sec-independent protein translocase protein TatB